MVNAVVFEWFWGAEVQESEKSAYLAQKCVLESKSHPFDLGKHKGWSTWVILERKVLQRRHFSDLERFDRSGRSKPSVIYLRGMLLKKVKNF